MALADNADAGYSTVTCEGVRTVRGKSVPQSSAGGDKATFLTWVEDYCLCNNLQTRTHS